MKNVFSVLFDLLHFPGVAAGRCTSYVLYETLIVTRSYGEYIQSLALQPIIGIL